jgi:hypothetical protein
MLELRTAFKEHIQREHPEDVDRTKVSIDGAGEQK